MRAPGRIALVGSDALTTPLADVESWLGPSTDPRCAVITVSRGVIMLGDSKVDAEGEACRAAVARSGLICVGGTDPGAIVRALRGSPLWAAICDSWGQGASIAGLGAGAVALGGYLPDVRHPTAGGTVGLGLIPSLRVIDTFDTRTRLIPDSALSALVSPGHVVVGIDSDTALIGQPSPDGGRWEFRSRGRHSAWRIELDRRRRVNAPLMLDVAT